MKQSLFAAEKRSLEGVPQRQLHAAGIARKNLVPFLEPGIAWDQIVTSVGVLVIVPDGVDVAGHILRVVEDIAKVSAKLDLLIFSANIEDLRERHIEIIGWIRRQSISTTGGEGAGSRLDVHRARICGQVRYGGTCAIGQYPYIASFLRITSRVDNGPVTSRIAIQVWIQPTYSATLRGRELRRLVCVTGRRSPIADQILCGPIGRTLHPGYLVHPIESQTVPPIECG